MRLLSTEVAKKWKVIYGVLLTINFNSLSTFLFLFKHVFLGREGVPAPHLWNVVLHAHIFQGF